VRKLSEVGDEVLIITVDSKTGHNRKLGTDQALEFLSKRTDTLSQVVTFLAGKLLFYFVDPMFS